MWWRDPCSKLFAAEAYQPGRQAGTHHNHHAADQHPRRHLLAQQNVHVAGLEEEIAQLINERFQLTVHKVVLAGQGTLPRTSSGKPQRRKTKQMVLDGAFAKPAKSVDGDGETA